MAEYATPITVNIRPMITDTIELPLSSPESLYCDRVRSKAHSYQIVALMTRPGCKGREAVITGINGDH